MITSRTRQSGQAIVESALVLVVFLAMLIGILDFGQFLYFHQSVVERARAAARYGAVHTYTDGSDTVNVAIYNDPAGTANGATAVLPCMASSCTANDGTQVQATITATVSDNNTDNARITVTINNYPYNFLSPFMSKITQLKTITASQPYESGF